MKKVLSLLAAFTLIVSLAVTPVFAGGGKVQGDNSAQGDVQVILVKVTLLVTMLWDVKSD